MSTPPQDRWDERYSEEGYAYGIEPNEYLKKQLQKLNLGTILFPAEGEGRNAVYAAQLGWNVSAFDTSKEGKKKALQLAEKKDVTIDYKVGLLPNLKYRREQFDVIALIFAHFPPEIKSQYHQLLSSYVKPDGIVILEAFSKKNLEYRFKNEKIGGPKDLDTLFSLEEVKADFHNFEIIELVEKEVELNEGLYHIGKGSVIRFVGRKK